MSATNSRATRSQTKNDPNAEFCALEMMNSKTKTKHTKLRAALAESNFVEYHNTPPSTPPNSRKQMSPTTPPQQRRDFSQLNSMDQNSYPSTITSYLESDLDNTPDSFMQAIEPARVISQQQKRTNSDVFSPLSVDHSKRFTSENERNLSETDNDILANINDGNCFFVEKTENLGSVLEDKDKIINQLKQDIDQLKKNVSQKVQTKEHYEKQALEYEEKVLQLEEENGNLLNENLKLTSKNEDETMNNQMLLNEKNDLMSQIELLKSKNTQLEKEKNDLQNEIKSINQGISSLKIDDKLTEEDQYIGYFQSNGPANGLNVYQNKKTLRKFVLSKINKKIYFS